MVIAILDGVQRVADYIEVPFGDVPRNLNCQRLGNRLAGRQLGTLWIRSQTEHIPDEQQAHRQQNQADGKPQNGRDREHGLGSVATQRQGRRLNVQT